MAPAPRASPEPIGDPEVTQSLCNNEPRAGSEELGKEPASTYAQRGPSHEVHADPRCKSQVPPAAGGSPWLPLQTVPFSTDS